MTDSAVAHGKSMSPVRQETGWTKGAPLAILALESGSFVNTSGEYDFVKGSPRRHKVVRQFDGLVVAWFPR